MKCLSSKQVQSAQELSRYHFEIDYCQGKTNENTDAPSPVSKRDDEKKTTF